MKKIGSCPVCHKGQLLEFEDKYQCDYVDQSHRFCNFFFYKLYSGKNLSIEMIFDLLHNYQTKFYTDFINSDGSKFEAALKISDGFVKLYFKNAYLDGARCINCDAAILKTVAGYGCENYYDKKCGMFIYPSYNGFYLTDDHVRFLTNGEFTPFIHDFMTQTGQKFSSKLYVDDFNFQVKFDYTIGSCPKCSNGSIIKMDKFFGCTNYLTEIKCDFIIWPSIFGYSLSFEDVELLLNGLITDTKSFVWNEKEFSGVLSLDEKLKLKVI